jgi:capsular exopolysaccharide synthesis family protein
MKVVGTLPNLPNRHRLTAPQTQNVPGPYWGNLLGESITYLRTRLLHENKDNSKQLLMIASAMPEEGKTMVAGHLAISIAQSGKRTLIVDGDLRRPILGSLFQAPASRGFCEVLRGEAKLSDVIFPTPVEGLFLLPAGSCSKEVLQALSQETLREMFAKLRSEFDFIIVDSCPLLPVSDGLLLGRLMDGVVLCIRPGVSETPSVLAAYERLRGLNISVEGVVINGERTTFKSAGYLRYLGSDKAAG